MAPAAAASPHEEFFERNQYALAPIAQCLNLALQKRGKKELTPQIASRIYEQIKYSTVTEPRLTAECLVPSGRISSSPASRRYD